ncbi:MAG: endonuclease [Candidatus Micrarchaeota archaeon]
MKKRLKNLYQKLLKEHGRQHWWPADSRYEVVVGALLTQNTNWKNVGIAIANLKKAKCMDPKKVLSMPRGRFESLIRPSGFFRQKAERLKLLTKKYLEIRKKKWKADDLRAELLSVNGVGKETADSIILYAFDLRVFVIDAYTRRFCAHHGLFEGKNYEDYQEFFESNLPKSLGMYKEFHALIVEWGKERRAR